MRKLRLKVRYDELLIEQEISPNEFKTIHEIIVGGEFWDFEEIRSQISDLIDALNLDG